MDSLHKEEYALDALMPLIRERLAAGQSVRFSPRGTSMLPLIREGKDSVILSPLPEKLKKYDLPLYQRKNGAYVLHRIVKTGACYTCIGDNQFQKEPGVDRGQMIALVTGVVRDGKTWDVKSFSYWLYCRWWHFSRPIRHLRFRWRARRGRQ